MEDHLKLDAGVFDKSRESTLFQNETGARKIVRTGHGGLEVMVQDGAVSMDFIFGLVMPAVDPCGVKRMAYAPMTTELTEEQRGLGASQLTWTLKNTSWQRNGDTEQMTLPEELQRFDEMKRMPEVGDIISTLEAGVGTEEMEEATKGLPDEQLGVCGRVHRMRKIGDDAVRKLATCRASMEEILENAAVPACEAQKLRQHKSRMEQYADAAKVAYR